MKNLSVKIISSALVVFLFTGISFAQESGTKTRDQKKDQLKTQDPSKDEEQLKTQNQLRTRDQDQVKDQNQSRIQARNAEQTKLQDQSMVRDRFRASLTDEQKKILENKEMTREQKERLLTNHLPNTSGICCGRIRKCGNNSAMSSATMPQMNNSSRCNKVVRAPALNQADKPEAGNI